MLKIQFKFLTLTIFLLLSFGALATHYGTLVIINGQHLSRAQLASLEAQIGTRIAPGNYLVADNGCWFNQSNGRRGCPGNSYSYNSRHGSGSRDGKGNWNHWSNAAGGGVGGTSDGCLYTTFGWSNC